MIGNPPYKEKAKGRGGWIEAGGSGRDAPLLDWMPPKDWNVGAHAKHLRNLYVYFWRWATWKVFDQFEGDGTGIVCFITVAGFLNGPGFQKMRDYLRRTATDLWVIDCSPEGHQPGVNTRIFQGVQHPVCIVLAARSGARTDGQPAAVHYRQLPAGHRDEKFKDLAKIGLDDGGWKNCPTGWREPFLPEATGEWATFAPLEDLFLDNSSGVMPGRTWVIAPDRESLIRRWDMLTHARAEEMEALFHPHLRGGELGDKHTRKIVRQGLGPRAGRPRPIADEDGECVEPVQYGFRSFDRQWIIPDARLINQPNPELWTAYSDQQIHLTAPQDRTPTAGPALTCTALIPDLHHYHGRGGRVFALWSDANARRPNVSPVFISILAERLNRPVTAEDALAYIAGITASSAYTQRFQMSLKTPGIRVPLTTDRALFDEAVAIGREVIWLHTFGERLADPRAGRPASPPRLEHFP